MNGSIKAHLVKHYNLLCAFDAKAQGEVLDNSREVFSGRSLYSFTASKKMRMLCTEVLSHIRQRNECTALTVDEIPMESIKRLLDNVRDFTVVINL
jgi:hypothetical protein